MSKLRLFYIIPMLLASHNLFAVYKLEKVIHKQSDSQVNSNPSISPDLLEEVTSEQISEANISSVDDILRQATSATTTRGPRSTAEGIQVRGLDNKKIFISIDGKRQNFRSGHSSVISVDLENLKKVEVYKNNGDFSKGSSLGGGVSFTTKDPEDYLLPGKNSASEFKYQNNGANSESIYNGKGIFKKKSISGIFSLTNSTANNMSLSDGSSLENSGYNETRLFSKILYRYYKISLEHSVKTDNNPTDPSLNPPPNDDNFTSLFSDTIRTKNELNIEFDKDRLAGNVYYSDYTEEKKERESKEIEKRNITTVGLNLKKQVKSWTIGAEGFLDSLDGSLDGEDVTAYPKASSSHGNIYIQRDISFSKFTFSPGAKYSLYAMELDNADSPNQSGNALLKKASLSFSPNKNFDITHTYSEGFNPPRVNEVYPSGLHARGDDFFIRDNFFIQNTNLKPELSKMNELSLRLNIINDRKQRLRLVASAYENRIEDYILLERIDRSILDEQNGTTQFINSPNVFLYGNEVKLSYLNNNIELDLSHTQVRGRDLNSGLYLEDLPADQYQYRVKYYLDKYDLSFGYLGIQSLEQNRVNPQTIQRTDPTDSSFIHNIFFEKNFGQSMRTSLRVDNLGDNRYRRHGSHLFETKQDIKLAFQYKINTL